MQNNIKKPLALINAAVFLQQQRYLLPVSFLFYLYNGLNLADFIFFQGIFYFVCLLAEIPAGYLGDIFKRKNILIFSYCLFLARIFLWIFFRGYYIILAGEILYGLSKAFYRGVSDSYIYDYLKEKNIVQKMLNKYGKYNFFMSLGCAISAILGTLLYKYFGFKILLIIEFLIHTTAIILLFLLPQVPHAIVKAVSLKEHTKTIFQTVRNTIKNKNINCQMLYCGIIAGITSLFIWNFQPMLKSSGAPVLFFGILYFINHIIRAICSLNAKKITNKVNFNKFGMFVFISYLISFLVIIADNFYINYKICFISLIFVCLAIGMGLIYNIITTSLIHKFAKNETRATMSSVNNMLIGLCSGLFLIIYKNLISYISISNTFIVFTICFVFVFYFPYRISKNR